MAIINTNFCMRLSATGLIFNPIAIILYCNTLHYDTKFVTLYRHNVQKWKMFLCVTFPKISPFFEQRRRDTKLIYRCLVILVGHTLWNGMK